MAHQQRLQLLEQRSEHQRVLEAIGDGWIDSRKVQLRYRPLGSRRAFDDVFHPYLLEPSAIGHSTYAIGYSEAAQAIRVRKLERIERRPLVLDESFTVLEDFDPFRLLGGAWAIWFDPEATPVMVVLRFDGEKVIRRVGETRWHPSQRTERDGEGRLLWMAEVDEPQEMLPWIRAWGADCEVLAPLELREQMMGEAARLARLYNQQAAPPTDRHQLFRDIFG